MLGARQVIGRDANRSHLLRGRRRRCLRLQVPLPRANVVLGNLPAVLVLDDLELGALRSRVALFSTTPASLEGGTGDAASGSLRATGSSSRSWRRAGRCSSGSSEGGIDGLLDVALHGGRESGHVRDRGRRNSIIFTDDADSANTSGVPRLGLQLLLQLHQVPLGQLVVRPLGNFAEDPIDLCVEPTGEILLLLDLFLHRLRDDRPEHADEVVFGETHAILVLELRPLLQVGLELTDGRTIRERDKVTALEIGQLSRTTDILGEEGSPVLEAVELLSAD